MINPKQPNQPTPIMEVLKNQDLPLTQINSLKICPECGDYQEYIREAVIFKGTEIHPPKVLPKNCYCQQKKIDDTQRQILDDKEKTVLMDKYKAADIPLRFINRDFGNLDRSENAENIEACQKYVDCFDINILAGKGIFLVGEVGTRKSTLAYCMAKDLIKKRYSVRVVSFGKIIKELQATNSEKSLKNYNEVLNDLLKFDFTVIDDFGRETYTEKQLNVAFDFINEMNKALKCVAITANPDRIEYLKSEKFEHNQAFRAILDRLNEMCKGQTLIFTGESYRSKDD